jgi:hypothetical protein
LQNAPTKVRHYVAQESEDSPTAGITRPRDLLQEGNFFSNHGYLTTLADVYFARQPYSINVYRTEGRLFRLLQVCGRPIITPPFADFFQPIGSETNTHVQDLRYLPKVALKTKRAEGKQRPTSPAGRQPSPFIDWSLFTNWGSFVDVVKARNGNLFTDSRRRRRKAERELGLLRFIFDDPSEQAFEACMSWKSAQWRRTGSLDPFTIEPRHKQLFRQLRRGGLLAVSTLSAGETLLSVHIGALADNRLYWLMPAYDPDLARYSPGRLLLEDILAESFARQHAEFDFLIGDEDYKWHYATHTREIGPLGKPSLALFLQYGARMHVRDLLGRYPRVLRAARAMHRHTSKVRNALAARR